MEWLFGIKYKVWVINTPEKVNLYLWENWKNIFPIIDSLVKISNKKSFIRTSQSYQYENEWLEFGRMIWNKENNLKWTTKYRTDQTNTNKLEFYSTEVCSPDWDYYYSTGKNPDIYINIYHYDRIENLKEGILIAMPKKTANNHNELIEESIKQLNELITNSVVSIEERNWTPGKKYPNRIENMNPQELKKLISENSLVE